MIIEVVTKATLGFNTNKRRPNHVPIFMTTGEGYLIKAFASAATASV